jgi:hypothetical protein
MFTPRAAAQLFAAEGRPAADFLRLTTAKLRDPLVDDEAVTEARLGEALQALDDPAISVLMPLTIAAWGRRTKCERSPLSPDHP